MGMVAAIKEKKAFREELEKTDERLACVLKTNAE